MNIMKNLIGIFLIMTIAIAYFNIPLEWRRHKDIEHGNQLISQITHYQRQHHRLPENNDQTTLKELGFTQNKQGWQPAYQKQSPDSYRIIYQDGYTSPYLYWHSNEQKWALTNH